MQNRGERRLTITITSEWVGSSNGHGTRKGGSHVWGHDNEVAIELVHSLPPMYRESTGWDR